MNSIVKCYQTIILMEFSNDFTAMIYNQDADKTKASIALNSLNDLVSDFVLMFTIIVLLLLCIPTKSFYKLSFALSRQHEAYT